MSLTGFLGLLACAALGAGAGVALHALCAWLKWHAYVQLFFTLFAALAVFEYFLRSGLLVKA